MPWQTVIQPELKTPSFTTVLVMLTAVLGTENIVSDAVCRHGEAAAEEEEEEEEEEKKAQDAPKERWVIQNRRKLE